MKKRKPDNKIIFKKIIMIYMIISPIFDLQFFYNHWTTLLRIFILLTFTVLTIILYKDSRKKSLFLLAYYLAMALYLAIDYFHSKTFSSLVPGDFNYSIISEASTLLKLAMPFTILFIMKYQKFSKKEFFTVINSWVILIAGSIVLCNVCGYSLSSYSNELTRYSIFSWNQNLPIEYIATKGFFSFANQETVIIIVLLVLSLYEFLFINKKFYLSIILIMLSCLMLGTRISTYGGLLVLVFLTIFYAIYFIIYKKKNWLRLTLLIPVITIWLLLIPISPNSNRLEFKESMNTSENTNNNSIIEDKDVAIEKSVIEVLEENGRLGSQFYTKFYPYEYDPLFWTDIKDNHIDDLSNYRLVELLIIKRIWTIDDRKTNYLFGISNTRIQNVVNIERDFILQYYAFGILGLIIVIAYYLYSIINAIKTILKNRQLIDLVLFSSLMLFILCAFLTGNILNFLATIIPIAFVTSHIGLLKD